MRIYALSPFNYQLSVVVSKLVISLYFVAAVMVWKSPKTSAFIVVFLTILWFLDILHGADASSWQFGSLFVGQPMHWLFNMLPMLSFFLLALTLFRLSTKKKLHVIIVALLLVVGVGAPHIIYFEQAAFSEPVFNEAFADEDHAMMAETLDAQPCVMVVLSAGCGHCVQLARALAIKYGTEPSLYVKTCVRGTEAQIKHFAELTGWPETQSIQPLNFNVPQTIMQGRFPAIGAWNGQTITASISGNDINYWVIDHLESLGADY